MLFVHGQEEKKEELMTSIFFLVSFFVSSLYRLHTRLSPLRTRTARTWMDAIPTRAAASVRIVSGWSHSITTWYHSRNEKPLCYVDIESEIFHEYPTVVLLDDQHTQKEIHIRHIYQIKKYQSAIERSFFFPLLFVCSIRQKRSSSSVLGLLKMKDVCTSFFPGTKLEDVLLP